MNIKLKNVDKIKILNSTDIYNIMQKVLLRENKIDRDKEHFWTIGMDASNRVLYVELVSLGSTRKTIADPVQVYRVAVLKAALRVILVHNHPSGSMVASNADLQLTDKLIQAGRILDIEVADHLIINEKTYISFADNGTLDKLENSPMFIPDYKKKAEFKKAIEKEVKEKTEKEYARKIAKQMKVEGYTPEQITKITGLTMATIKRL